MKTQISEHFRKNDPILYQWIERIFIEELHPHENLYEHICDQIISQQLSGKAAETIFKKFKKLFPKGKITAVALLKIPDEKLRACGTSWAKVRSLKDLASKVKNKELDLENLSNLTNEDVIVELTKVKGIGPWTAEMFLMFTLNREDVFSHGDLGLRNAIKKIYGFKKEPTRQQIEKIVKKWSPYRTFASRILWRSLLIKEN